MFSTLNSFSVTILRIYNYYTHKDTSLLVNCHFLISLISVILLKGLDPARIVVRVRNHDHLKNQLQLKEEGGGRQSGYFPTHTITKRLNFIYYSTYILDDKYKTNILNNILLSSSLHYICIYFVKICDLRV